MFLVLNFTARHAPPLHQCHTWGPGTQCSWHSLMTIMEPRHDCTLWRQLSNLFKLHFFSQKNGGCQRMSVEVTKNDISQYIYIALIWNVDISWHQFSLDCDKTWNKVPYCPLGLDCYCGLHGLATDHKSWTTFLYRHNWLSTQPPVNSASSPLFSDSRISSWIRHGLQYKVYKILSL